MPTRERFGSIAISNSSRLPLISSPGSTLSPVTFPPGRARLATSPVLTGSVLLVMTIGTVVVAFSAATAFAWFPVTMTSTPSRTRSAARAAQPFHLAVGEAVLDEDILTNAVSEAPQALLECFAEMDLLLVRAEREVAHPVDSP